MPSTAYETLIENKADLDRLWELHAAEAGTDPGRKWNVEVLNKAAVVLVCALWEAYCEDVAAEGLDFLINHVPSPSRLPKPLRKTIAEAVRTDKNELAPWELAESGWKAVVLANANQATQRLTGNWNTPKSGPVKDLFQKAMGIEDITTNWRWHMNDVSRVTATLDEFVVLRGDIAHRAGASHSVKKSDGTRFYTHIARLAGLVDQAVSRHLATATGTSPW